MQVALNSDEEYCGGHLVFATAKGFVVPERPVGSATIHDNGVVHGVSPLKHGVRYGLFLCDTIGVNSTSPSPIDLLSVPLPLLNQDGHSGTNTDTDDDADINTDTATTALFDILLSAATNSLDFYEDALQFLVCTSDDELHKCLDQYFECLSLHRMNNSAHNSNPLIFPTFACEVLSHIHMLHPLTYENTNTALLATSDVETCAVKRLDLVSVCRKQATFMSKMVNLRDQYRSEGNYEGRCDGNGMQSALTYAVEEYLSFMASFRSSGGSIVASRSVPSLLVDHVWHTHMSISPKRYCADCIRICGCIVDHVID